MALFMTIVDYPKIIGQLTQIDKFSHATRDSLIKLRLIERKLYNSASINVNSMKFPIQICFVILLFLN